MVDSIDLLNVVSKKINRIEEMDSDFKNNERWLELRKQQESLWIELAKEKLMYLESKNKASITEQDGKLIKFYQDFINKGGLEK